MTLWGAWHEIKYPMEGTRNKCMDTYPTPIRTLTRCSAWCRWNGSAWRPTLNAQRRHTDIDANACSVAVRSCSRKPHGDRRHDTRP